MERYYVNYDNGYYDIKRGDKVVETRFNYEEAQKLVDQLNEGL